jgi:hypothetical protein
MTRRYAMHGTNQGSIGSGSRRTLRMRHLTSSSAGGARRLSQPAMSFYALRVFCSCHTARPKAVSMRLRPTDSSGRPRRVEFQYWYLRAREFRCILTAHDDRLPENSPRLLLSTLRECVLWQGQAGRLTTASSPGNFKPTPEKPGRGFFYARYIWKWVKKRPNS